MSEATRQRLFGWRHAFDEPVVVLIVAVLGAAGLIAVYRFGSTARGQSRTDSDIDFAVLATSRLDPLARYDVQERLAALVGRDVDLVDLRAASTVLAKEVVTTGVVISDDDPIARGAFEDLTYSSYARLCEERQEIIERIAREGTVLGR